MDATKTAADILASEQNATVYDSSNISLDQLKLLPTPPATETFSPISHFDFVTMIEGTADKVLSPQGYVLDDLSLKTDRDHKRIFGAMTFQKDRSDLKLSLAFRQSTDKSMAAAIAMGGRVQICSNMIISGKEVVFRKHTGDIRGALKDKIILTLFGADDAYDELQRDQEAMVSVPIGDDPAFGYFGVAHAHGLLSATQFGQAVSEWKEPMFDHGSPTAWKWYNSMTQVYKGLPIHKTMKMHRELHGFTKNKILSAEHRLDF
jgi:hypothetical protein